MQILLNIVALKKVLLAFVPKLDGNPIEPVQNWKGSIGYKMRNIHQTEAPEAVTTKY